jgi:hypothetical protein
LTLNLKLKEKNMSKVRHPQAIKESSIKPEISGTFENWFKCRQDRLKAQANLLQSCTSDADVNRYKAMGLLDFKGTSI